jgi:hypothetical protein
VTKRWQQGKNRKEELIQNAEAFAIASAQGKRERKYHTSAKTISLDMLLRVSKAA